jgi:hypothetical protein
MLKQEEERLIREQWELDQYEEEKKQMEKRYVQQDYGYICHRSFLFIVLFIIFSRQLLRQHKAKLHKRAKDIQEQLVCSILSFSSIFLSFNLKGIRHENSRIDSSCR